MYIVVHHHISDQAKFWEIAQGMMANLPEGLKLPSVFPAADASEAICLWEADSLDAVRRPLESALGHVCKNDYFEVDAQNAIGLPR